MDLHKTFSDQVGELHLTDRAIHVGIITGVWALVYPYIAYVIFPRPWDEIQLYYPTAKRMVTHGEWLIPHIGIQNFGLQAGEPYLQKPPLGIWFQGLSMEVFGTTLFAARLPSTIFGLASALLVYQIGRELYNWHTGLTAGLVFLAMPMLSIHHHSATTADLDIYLLFFGTAFVWLVWQKFDNFRWMVLAGVAGAAAALTKSFAAGVFLFVLLPVVIRHWERYLSFETLAGALTGLAVLIPWPLYAYLTYPNYFVDGMIMRQLSRSQGGFGRASNTLIPMSNWPYFKFVVGVRDGLWTGEFVPKLADKAGQVLAHLSVPVFVFLAAIGLVVARRRRAFDAGRDLFLAWWVLSVPLFFSLVGGNHDWYLLPMFAPLAILSAFALDQLRDELNAHPKLPVVTDRLYVGAAVLTVLVIYALWYILSEAPASPATA